VIIGFFKFLMLHHWLPSQKGFSELSGNKIRRTVKKFCNPVRADLLHLASPLQKPCLLAFVGVAAPILFLLHFDGISHQKIKRCATYRK
jgi:hypothetical protein